MYITQDKQQAKVVGSFLSGDLELAEASPKHDGRTKLGDSVLLGKDQILAAVKQIMEVACL